MKAWRTFEAELRKAIWLPASRIAMAVTLLGMAIITAINAATPDAVISNGPHAPVSPVEDAFSAIGLGSVGAVILGVVIMSSEYTSNRTDTLGGRQITATLTTNPNRLAVFAAKVVSVALLVFVATVVTMPASIGLAHLVSGVPLPSGWVSQTIPRIGGLAVYWVFTAWMALGITTLTRNGIAPLVILIANSSIVSVSLLLSRITDLAYYLPDIAGIRLVSPATEDLFTKALAPLPGGIIMGAWAAVFLGIGALVFVRRDA